ncbi:MAG: hypothetical protein ACLP7I_12075 [Limisphaerales bacterium]
MDDFDSLYGSLVTPLSSGPTAAGAAGLPAITQPDTNSSSGSGISSGDISSFLSTISSLGTAGVNAYKTFSGSGPAPAAAKPAASTSGITATLTKYAPYLLIGGGVLVVIVIIIALLKRK